LGPLFEVHFARSQTGPFFPPFIHAASPSILPVAIKAINLGGCTKICAIIGSN